MDDNRTFIGCGCPPGEFVVEADVEKDGIRYQVTGAGLDLQTAEADAEEHAFAVLGDGAVIHNVKPA